MKELAITLDTEKKQPLYEQIYEALREAILQGRILQGEKLPSTRFEAEYLQVSRSTVELAYDQLETFDTEDADAAVILSAYAFASASSASLFPACAYTSAFSC